MYCYCRDLREKKLYEGDIVDIYEDEEGVTITLDKGYEIFFQTK